ncbi:unnamed protein product [Aphanomyces euteiches]
MKLFLLGSALAAVAVAQYGYENPSSPSPSPTLETHAPLQTRHYATTAQPSTSLPATTVVVPTPAVTTPSPSVATSEPTTIAPDFEEDTPEPTIGNECTWGEACRRPDGTLVECLNPNHRQCCFGEPYFVWLRGAGEGGTDAYQSCCQDADGNPLIVLGSTCPTTVPESQPTTTTPAVTTDEPSTVLPVTYNVTVKPAPTTTPAPQTTTSAPTTTPLPTPASTAPQVVITPEPTSAVPDFEEEEKTPEPTTSSIPPTTTPHHTIEPTTTKSSQAAPLPTPASTIPVVVVTPEPTSVAPDYEEDDEKPTETPAPSSVPPTTTPCHPFAPTTDAPTDAPTEAPTEAPTTTAAPAATPSTPVLEPKELPQCLKTNFEAAHAAAIQSQYTDKCAVDIGMPCSDFKKHVKPTVRQIAKLNASENCKAYYGDLQAAARREHCFDLDIVATNVSFDMAIGALEVDAFPKTTTNCTTWNRPSFTKLALKASFYSCLASTSLGSHVFALTTLPSVDQLRDIKNNTHCRDLFPAVQSIIRDSPTACAYGSDGVDIHAYASLSFDVALDWLILIAQLTAQDATTTTAFTFAATSAPHSSLVVVGGVLAVCALLVVFVVLKRSQQRRRPRAEERKRLLQV